MTNEALQSLISSWFPNPEPPALEESTELPATEDALPNEEENTHPSLLEFNEEGSQFLNVGVPSEMLHGVLERLRDDEQTRFNYLFCLTGVDWGAELGVVYHLESTEHRHIIVVKVKTADRENPTLDTVSDLWATAEFHEREVFDFFGIKFKGHPNLKRLFLTDEWDGFPLRKDYEDEINMVIK